ncbi:hypothetical protein AOA80_04240 [Methanomassiliicoccales archaeon RumEn M1]|nr:hypothetical protein AOA80_04240 [Methanomassiliicoccales archaeon RumEn M1]
MLQGLLRVHRQGKRVLVVDDASRPDQGERLLQEPVRGADVSHHDPVGDALAGKVAVVPQHWLHDVLHAVQRHVLPQVLERHRVDLARDDLPGPRVHGERQGPVADAGEHVHHRLAPAVQGGHAQLLVDVARREHEPRGVQLVVQSVLEVHRLGALAVQHLHHRRSVDAIDAPRLPQNDPGAHGLRVGGRDLLAERQQLLREPQDEHVADLFVLPR